MTYSTPIEAQNLYVQNQLAVSAARDIKRVTILHFVYSALVGCSSLGVAACALFILNATAEAIQSGVHMGRGSGPIVLSIPMLLLFAVLGLLWSATIAGSGFLIKLRILRIVSCGVCATCLFAFPFGTLFGVYVLGVLTRPSVKALYR